MSTETKQPSPAAALAELVVHACAGAIIVAIGWALIQHHEAVQVFAGWLLGNDVTPDPNRLSALEVIGFLFCAVGALLVFCSPMVAMGFFCSEDDADEITVNGKKYREVK